FFQPIRGQAYPLDYEKQGIAYLFADTGIQFWTLNSCWQIDQHFRKRASVNPQSVAHLIQHAEQQIVHARGAGALAPGGSVLRIGVWHHAVAGPGLMADLDFLGHLMRYDIRIGLHGDVHELRRELVGYWHEHHMFIIGAGSFDSPASGRPESTPRL